jgi:mRNA interferase HigB
MPMRIISLKTLKAFWGRHPGAQKPLREWFGITEAAQWRNFMDVRSTFGSADTARVKSGNTATIFDIGGNKYRLITAIHYNVGNVYAMLVLTHTEYDTGTWKAQL